MPKWDWYQGTIPKADPQDICDALTSLVELSDVAPAKPMHGYRQAAEIVRGSNRHALIWWGGNPGVHVTLTGPNADSYGDWLRKQGVQPSRVDVCEDWSGPGLADDLFAKAQRLAVDSNIKISHQGDWTRGRARTLYVGSSKGTSQLVIYEKGHQLTDQGHQVDQDWVRMEVRLKPKKNRDQVAALEPLQAMFASKWIGEFLTRYVGWESIEPLKMGTVWQPRDADRARAALLRQYSKIIAQWAEDVGGWDELGGAIQRQVEVLEL